jgi:energy-coupling factor transporter ATP-binding protein EcfA2
MTEGDIQQRINQAQYAATSATGSAVINIYNYYYHEDIRLAPVKPADTCFDNLPCPYRGLYHFNPNDAELFFGRDSQVEELVKATAKRNFIPIWGASGSGKSSLVFAGLVPELQKQGNWLFTHFSLGSNPDPFYALAQALVPLYSSEQNSTKQLNEAKDLAENLLKYPLQEVQERMKEFFEKRINLVFTSIQHKHPRYKLLLIADQFEQLYTSCKDEAKRNRFLDCLLSIIQSPINNSLATVLVTTMRADFLDDALSYRPFADALQNTDIKLGPMNREEREQVIEEPALKRGVTFQEGLVERILDHVDDNQPGHLPLLEFALTLLWERRTERLKQQTEQQEKRTAPQLTHADYEAIGKVKGAIAKYANNIYENLDSTQQKQVQKIFIQLVDFSQGTKDIRKLTKKAELGEESWCLVQLLADKRLVVTNRNADGQDTAEIIHEALIREWDLLKAWIDENRTFRTWQERLRRAMHQWETANQEDAALLRGSLLSEAEAWQQQRLTELSKDERDFILLSLALRDREEKEKEARRQRELQQQKTKTRLARITAVLAFSTLAFGGFAWLQQQRAEQASQAFLLGIDPPKPELLEKLPSYLQEANKLKDIGIKEKNNLKIDLALAYYRKILTDTIELNKFLTKRPQDFENPRKAKEIIKNTTEKTKDSLIRLIIEERMPQIEYDLKKHKIGRRKSKNELIQERLQENPSFNAKTDSIYDYIKLGNNYQEGALRKTYEILMGKFGLEADENFNGLLDENESNRIPCKVLEKIEDIWRNQTKNHSCGWYGSRTVFSAPECQELEGQTLTALIFAPPYDFAVDRLKQCQIIPNSINETR